MKAAQTNKNKVSLLAIAAALMVTACGGGGDSSSTSNASTATTASSTSPDSSCFTLPGNGKTATVTASTTVPVEVTVATITGAGAQSFEGQSYSGLDVHAQIAGIDQHHALFMLPNAPFLPAGAISYPSVGDTDPQQRYAYTYSPMTLEQLRTAIISGKASFGSGLSYAGLVKTVPAATDFQLNTPVTLVMLEQQAGGTASLPTTFKTRYIKELTLTYAGREDVSVGSATYAQACKFSLAVRRTDFNGLPFSITNVATGNLWFAPGVGLVKAQNSGSVLGTLTSLSVAVTPAP
ncbi:hypothetical protein N5B55_00115 [Ralstonia pickettii]|uniref:hypothetical protein n=1 Tax=Ralstonia pickettii TaxID=329 RepID=UPI0027148E98|nr:hypothetical protein [Ralstonia pickettii]WKZ85396.1 hypothetical protein N5B55_00115 [Ralstonia pickettii]